jgi:site-specific DNA recombinase
MRNNAHVHVLTALDAAVAGIPFEVTGLDFDNGSEFINHDVALTEKGLTTRPTRVKPAAPLHPQNVHRILLNRVYVGLVSWKGQEYRGRHEALVDVETFATVQAILHSRAQTGEKPKRHTHYLKGSLFCGRCGSPLGFVHAKGNGGNYDYFFCWRRHRSRSCDLPYLPADIIERHVESTYQHIQVSGQVLLDFREHILGYMRQRLDGAEKLADAMRKRIVRLEAERRRLLQAHLAGAVPIELLKEEQDRISRQLAQAGAELVNTEIDWTTVERNVRAAIGLVSQLHDIYLKSEPVMRRRINQACWAGFDIDDDDVAGARLTDPLAALIAEDLVDHLSGAEKEDPDPLKGGQGSTLTALVVKRCAYSNRTQLRELLGKVPGPSRRTLRASVP